MKIPLEDPQVSGQVKSLVQSHVPIHQQHPLLSEENSPIPISPLPRLIAGAAQALDLPLPLKCRSWRPPAAGEDYALTRRRCVARQGNYGCCKILTE